METQYFIPIKSINLGHYFQSGIISPSNYIENKNADIQDRFENYILLSTRKYTNETNCALEIVLNPEEEVPTRISENFYLFDMPLPISRIKGVYFTTDEQKTTSEFDITSGAAFIPNNLLKVENEKGLNTTEIQNIQFKPTEANWKHQLNKFDQLMGGFALMPIAKEDFQNYPTHYFKSLGNINHLFNKLLTENIEIDNPFEFAFTDNKKFKKFQQTIFSDINMEIVQEYAKNDDFRVETKNGLIKLETISEEKKTYYVAILESYGKGKRKQVDSFISDLISGKLTDRKKEGLSLIFGLNKGYKSFRNEYKTENFETIIKFKLDSQLDYYIIESIYQNVFNDLNDINSFEYIDDFCIRNKDDLTTSGFETYRVLDKTIILKKKQEFFPELFHFSSEKRNEIYWSIVKKISSWFPKFFKPDSEELIDLFRDELESSLREYALLIHNETKSEIENNNALLENLNKTINEKDEVIHSLQKQIQEMSSNKKEEASEETLKDISGDKPEIYQKKEDPPVEQTEAENPESLFPAEKEIPIKKSRQQELYGKKVDELRIIAKNLKISISKLKKEDLVSAILKTELKK